MVLTRLAVNGEGCTLPLHCTYPIADYMYRARDNDNGDVRRQVPALLLFLIGADTTGSKPGGEGLYGLYPPFHHHHPLPPPLCLPPTLLLLES